MPLPLPPFLYAPIYNLAVGLEVHVSGVLPNSEVSLWATPANQPALPPSKVGHASSMAGGDVWVPLTTALTRAQTVTATQTNSGAVSAASNPVVVQARPKLLPPPVFLSKLSTCMGSLRIGGLIEGCTLHVTAAGTSLVDEVVRRPIASVQAFEISSSVTIAQNAVLAAYQTFEGDPSKTTTSAPVALSPHTPLGKPTIVTPVWPCQTAINLTGLTEGSDLTIVNPANGNETGFGNTFQNLQLTLVAPLQQGPLTAQQAFRRCAGTQSPTDVVQVPAARPLPTPNVLYAPFTGYEQLLVSNVVPGEILSVSRVVVGGGTELLGEQMASGDPTTVNLPPFSATDPSGGAVSLLVKGTLCDNAAASASIAAPVSAPASLGGNTQFIFWGGLGTDNRPIPILGLVVEIIIDEAIVVSPTSGVTPATPNALPIGFQIDGYPPAKDTQPGQTTVGWTPTKGDLAIGWQQYGVKMWPNTTNLISFAEYWPATVEANRHVLNTFNLSTPTPVTLPNDLTIPAGWTIRFVFRYEGSTITGFDCTVKDQTGASVGPDMGINFLAPQNQLAAGGPIGLGDLSQLVAFQVALVGFWSSADATLLSGGGRITCQSRTPLTVQTSWPADSPVGAFPTAENTNSTYGLLPPGPSTSFTQTFGVT